METIEKIAVKSGYTLLWIRNLINKQNISRSKGCGSRNVLL